MQQIYKPSPYPSEVLVQLKRMRPFAIEIANRWAIGWSKGVQELIQSGEYLDALRAAEELERDAFCNPNLSRSWREIVALYRLSIAPPEVSVCGPFCGIGNDDVDDEEADSQSTSLVNDSPTKKKHGLISFEVSEPYESDGKLMRSILATHADGFVCLRFEEVERQGHRR